MIRCFIYCAISNWYDVRETRYVNIFKWSTIEAGPNTSQWLNHIANWKFTSVFSHAAQKKSNNKSRFLRQRLLWKKLPQGFSPWHFIILFTSSGSLFSHQRSEPKRSTERLWELFNALLKLHGVKTRATVALLCQHQHSHSSSAPCLLYETRICTSFAIE